MADNVERKLGRIRARDEVNELVEERATALAEAEASRAFRPMNDTPEGYKARVGYRARARKELGL